MRIETWTKRTDFAPVMRLRLMIGRAPVLVG
ncbi:hypothetical protein BJ122_101237 [Rhodopseudomonas faecalis]|uniref:Uncharacterized protein n=1 Tax=Rhodopseudomonas faecalis TaxID=99655 RepID=A0A318TLH0_9BRAD|nr:hypothetical protein BJ122_101237 [Rhodopseudomonas faecalis]